MIEIKAPEMFSWPFRATKIFLSGPCDSYPGWRERLMEAFQEEEAVFLNPVRQDYSKLSDLALQEQIDWELSAMEASNLVVVRLMAGTKSMLTMVELGLTADKAIIWCDHNFEHRAYIERLCEWYGTPLFDDLRPTVDYLRLQLRCSWH